MKLYKKALRNLTLGYMAAIIVACAAFTLPVFILANRQIDENDKLLHDTTALLRPNGSSKAPHENAASHASESRATLLTTTLIVDGVLITLGALVSYFFARKTLAPLEAAHKAQERFTADASHELRTPLAILQTELEVALKDKNHSAGLETAVRGAIQDVRRLSVLTEKLLQLTRPDAKAAKDTVNLSAVVEQTIRQLEQKHGIPITHDITPSAKKVEADEALLKQLVEILVDNAVKYAPPAGPEIRVQLAPTDQGALLTIIDNGIGISKKDLPHVFDRLYRGTNATRQEGHGLGLALAKSIADIHGWKLELTSELSKGTTVRVVFPNDT
jgi:two-component system, OmpR family, sensor histidine kinase CiaH